MKTSSQASLTLSSQALATSDIHIQHRTLRCVLSVLRDVTAAARLMGSGGARCDLSSARCNDHHDAVAQIADVWRLALQTASQALIRVVTNDALSSTTSDEEDDSSQCSTLASASVAASPLDDAAPRLPDDANTSADVDACFVTWLQLAGAVSDVHNLVVEHLLAKYCSVRATLTSSESHAANSDDSSGVLRSAAFPFYNTSLESIRQRLVQARACQSSSDRVFALCSKKKVRTFREWLEETVTCDSTAAALRILSACKGFAADGVEEALSESFVECTSASKSSFCGDSQNRLYYIVPAARVVAPCQHVTPCFGNHNLLFVVMHSPAGSPSYEDATVFTVMSTRCSVGASDDDDGDDDDNSRDPDAAWGLDRTVEFGHLHEGSLPRHHRRQLLLWSNRVHNADSPLASLPSSDERDHVATQNAEGDDIIPSCSPLESNCISLGAPRRLAGSGQQREVRAFLAIAENANVTAAAERAAEAKRQTSRRGPRAGDAMFIAELIARLEFWVNRGSPARDYVAQFARHGDQCTFEDAVERSRENITETVVDSDAFFTRRPSAPLAEASNSLHKSRKELVAMVPLPLWCLSSPVDANAMLEVSVPVHRDSSCAASFLQTTGADSDDLARLRAAINAFSGCVLSVLTVDLAATPGDFSDEHQASSVSLKLLMTDVQQFGSTSSSGASSSSPTYAESTQAEVERRKLLHRLQRQQCVWEGVVWEPDCARIKSRVVCRRGVAQSSSSSSASACCFVLKMFPMVAPALVALSKHTALLVDLDRTIVDNAMSTTAPSNQRRTNKHHQGNSSVCSPSCQTALVSWLVSDVARLSPSLLPREVSAFATNTASSIVHPSTKIKSEHVRLRPDVMAFLSTWTQHWNVVAVLATKSTTARAGAILAQLADRDGAVFGTFHTRKPPCSRSSGPNVAADVCEKAQYRIYGAEALLSCGDCGNRKTYVEALLEARKSARDIIRDSLADVLDVAACRRFVVLDDTPYVWVEDDWRHVVPVAPFTLGRHDSPDYWSQSGCVAYKMLSALLFETCVFQNSESHRAKRLRQNAEEEDSGESDAAERHDDEDEWWAAYVKDGKDGSLGASDDAAVVDEEVTSSDESDTDLVDLCGNRLAVFPTEDGGWSSSKASAATSWAANPNVEDVVPL